MSGRLNEQVHASLPALHNAQIRLGRDSIGLGQTRKDVFHDHHRAVHHHPDGDRQAAQRHQVGRNTPIGHDGESQSDRQRYGQQHQQRGAQVHQEDRQHDDDQDECQQQRVGHHGDGLVDQVGLVIVGIQRHTVGQGLRDQRHPVVDAFDGGIGIGSYAFEHDARHDLAARLRPALSVAVGHGDGALADFTTQFQSCEVFHLDHDAVDFLDRNVADVREPVGAAAYPADRAQDQLLVAAVDVPPARVAVVGFDCFNDLADGQVVTEHAGRVQLHLILQHVAAEREDVGHAVDRQQQQLDHPIVQAA